MAKPAYANLGPPEPIVPLFPGPPSLTAWHQLKPILKQRWDLVLGAPTDTSWERRIEVMRTFERPGYRATVVRQSTGAHTCQTLVLLEPVRPIAAANPGIVLPFYNPDRLIGLDIVTLDFLINESPLTQFGRHLVDQGYTVVCTEAFPFNTVPKPDAPQWQAWWQAGADKILQDNPHWTGMGKLVHDTRLALDFLLAQPGIDEDRIGIMGHSLGGKMAFYSGCLDPRVTVMVISDFGMGWSFSNWDAPWYLGPQIKAPDFDLAHHHLLALAAPKPCLIIGGEADRPATWQYLNEARQVYDLYDQPSAIGFFDHASGHRPTLESLEFAYRWLAKQLEINPPPFRLPLSQPPAPSSS